jgi:hypothetical protein
LSLLEAALASWRLAHMLVIEKGPADIFARFRVWSGIEYGTSGAVLSYPDWNPLHCLYCTSMYTSIAVLMVPKRLAHLRRALAVSGLVILIEGLVLISVGDLDRE